MDADTPFRRAQLRTAGMPMATMGVLFRKADATALLPARRASTSRRSCPPPSRRVLTRSRIPVSRMAAATT